MSATTLYLNLIPQIARSSGTALLQTKGPRWPYGGISFPQLGDIYTLNLNWIYWVTGISSIDFDTTGESATRTLTKEYQYSTDGGETWSSVADISTLTGLSFPVDGEELFHLRLVLTRAGASTSSSIVLDNFRMRYTFNNLNAKPWVKIGPMTQDSTPNSEDLFNFSTGISVHAQIKSVIQSVVDYLPGTFARNKRYKFFYGHPDSCFPDNTTPYIFLFDIKQINQVRQINRGECLIQFRLGIKRTVDNTRHPNEEDTFEIFVNQANQLFNLNFNSNVFDVLTILGIQNYGVTLADLGVHGCRTFGEFFDHSQGTGKDKCNEPESWQTNVEFRVGLKMLNRTLIF